MPNTPHEEAAFLREQAERCRWLATQSRDPKTVITLNNMAKDYEARAAALESGAAQSGG